MTELDVSTVGRRSLRRRLALLHAPGRAVPLADLLPVGPLPAAAALDVLGDVAAELRARWEEHGAIHGDLRPAAVLVRGDGSCTLTGATEAAGGSRRGDAYWFAVLACELLTGTRPIERADAACLMGSTAGFPAAARQALLAGLNPRPKRRPLPHQLLTALREVPRSDWPDWSDGPTEEDQPAEEDGPAEEDAPTAAGNPDRSDTDPAAPTDTGAPEPRRARPDDATAVAVPTPPEVPRAPIGEPAPPGLLRRVGPYVAALGLVAVPATAAVGAELLGLLPAGVGRGAGTGLEVETATLRMTPPTTHCPRATVHLDTRVTTNGEAGTVRLSWHLPDGSPLHERALEVEEGQTRARVLEQVTVTGKAKVRGRAYVTVHPGGTRAETRFRFDC